MKLSCQILLGLLIVTAASCHPTWNLLTDQDPKRPASTYVRLRLAPVSVPEGPWSRRCAASGGIQLRAKTARATRTVWMSGVFQLEPGPRRLELTFKATSVRDGEAADNQRGSVCDASRAQSSGGASVLHLCQLGKRPVDAAGVGPRRGRPDLHALMPIWAPASFAAPVTAARRRDDRPLRHDARPQ